MKFLACILFIVFIGCNTTTTYITNPNPGIDTIIRTVSYSSQEKLVVYQKWLKWPYLTENGEDWTEDSCWDSTERTLLVGIDSAGKNLLATAVSF